ncbi:MAG: hypothetical protein ACK4K7_02200 [Allosphingosinicella sp.]|uniref:hypothetical protein n=1 Tax=Allosphingosinicella sp. TaxID=2823234 RepID=UPI003952829E
MYRLALMPALAAAALATPSPAAAHEQAIAAADSRSGAFVGAQLRVDFAGPRAGTPLGRLTAGTTHIAFDARGMPVRGQMVRTLELGLSRDGRADLFIGGEPYADVRHRLGIAPGAVAALAIGGVAAIGVALSSSSNKQPYDAVCLGIGICPELPRR